MSTLAAHQKILELARQHGREVWFDIHVWTDHPPEPAGLRPERSYIEQLGKIAPGAKYKVVVFEYNSGNHAQKRALANALATNEAERIGDLLPIACSANCLQPDGQNDNGWDQGLLFLDPSQVWLQPPGYVTQMTRRHYQPLLVESEVRGDAGGLSVNAKRSEDGRTLVVQVVNRGAEPRPARIEVEGFSPSRPSATARSWPGRSTPRTRPTSPTASGRSGRSGGTAGKAGPPATRSRRIRSRSCGSSKVFDESQRVALVVLHQWSGPIEGGHWWRLSHLLTPLSLPPFQTTDPLTDPDAAGSWLRACWRIAAAPSNPPRPMDSTAVLGTSISAPFSLRPS